MNKRQIKYRIKKLEKSNPNPSLLTSKFLEEKERLYKELDKIKLMEKNRGLIASQAKDKRITTLSLFRDLSHIKDEKERLEKAFELVEMIYKKYPLPPMPEEKEEEELDF